MNIQQRCLFFSFSFFTFFTQVSLITALYSWVCQMLHEISYQIINIYAISGQNRTSMLLWH